MDDVTRFTLAAEHVVRALNAGGATAEVSAAFSDDVQLLRYGWGQAADRVVEQLQGREALATWLARSPATARFRLAGDAIPTRPGEAVQRYGVEMDGFVNGGRWLLRLDQEGLVCHWEHRPGDLDPDIQDQTWRARVEEALRSDPSLRPLESDRERGDP